MAAMPNLVSWFVFKAMLGLSLSIIWAAAELWINVAVDDGHRGRAFSMFTLLYWFGFGCGPMIIAAAGVDGAVAAAGRRRPDGVRPAVAAPDAG